MKEVQDRVKKLVKANAEGRALQDDFKSSLTHFLADYCTGISVKDMADILEGKAQSLRAVELQAERVRREELYKLNQDPPEAPPIRPVKLLPEKLPAAKAEKMAQEVLAARGVTLSPVTDLDAPPCSDCGSIMVRNGSCYKCTNCGSTSGCS
jgi:hypothetical protein